VRRWGIDVLAIHSPLVGPSTIQPLADALDDVGWSTTVPDLRDALSSPAAYGDAVRRAVDSVDIVIGHSGAGAILPTVAANTSASATVFIDALVPDTSDVFMPSGRFIELLDSLPVSEGLLPPWHEWWPAETLERVLPDESLRRLVVSEIPRVPRSFYDQPIPLPEEWWTRPAAYLQLSPAYDDDRERAERWGWPTCQLSGHHLDLVTRPDAIARIVTDLVGAAHRDHLSWRHDPVRRAVPRPRSDG
jgi:hypothetical protein